VLYQVTPEEKKLSFFQDDTIFLITLEPGKYSADQLATHITEELVDAGSNIVCDYSTRTLKIMFSDPVTDFALYFTYGNSDQNLVSLLGFEHIEYPLAAEFVAETAYHGYSKLNAVYIACPELGFHNQFMSISPNFPHNIIAKIPLSYNELSVTPLSYNPNQPQIIRLRYEQPIAVNKLSFRMVGLRKSESGAALGWYNVDFNGQDVSFSIEFLYLFIHFLKNDSNFCPRIA